MEHCKNGFLGLFQTTGIGSLPFAQPREAAQFVLDAELSIPFWPQLPKRDFRELMIPQYSEGMPCLEVDRRAQRIFCDTSDKAEQLERFYAGFLSEDPEAFPVSQSYAAGLYSLKEMCSGRTWGNFKVQTTGPFTFTQGINNMDREPVYNDPDLRDAAVKLLARKTQWQIRQFRKLSKGPVIAFLDEPLLSAYGSSSYVGVSESNIHDLLRELLDAISAEGAISAIHVCGNSDWGVVVRSGVELLNFDAYEYGYSIALYSDDVRRFFERGGNIAWGIVPTSEAVRGETADTLAKRLADSFSMLEKKGIRKALIEERCVLTPSCGAGSLSVDDTKRVFDLLHELREKLAG